MHKDELYSFVEQAHPHSWFLVADNLHEQVLKLRKQRSRIILTKNNVDTGQAKSWEGANRSTFLLGGFVLENAIKALLVYENPSWISNGRLSRRLLSHSLTMLADKSIHIPYKKQGRWILAEFERGLESWARYPCALSIENSEEEQIMTDPLWAGYLRLTTAYGRRLRTLLSKQWNGPHGWTGRFHISGNFLSIK